MLEENEIISLVSGVAKANLRPKVVESVRAEPATDSDGRDALRITIVIAPGSAATVSGDAALDTLFKVQDLLRQEGEDRFPIIEYATRDELKKRGN